MPNIPTTTRRARGLTALAAATAFAVTMLMSTAVDAAPVPKTESAEAAASAVLALDALERWNADGQLADYFDFRSNQARAARLIALDVDVVPAALIGEWVSTHEGKQVAVLSALTQLGVPYRSMTSKPGEGFDCSGLTIWAYAQAGVELPRISRDQIRAADPVDIDDAEPGDLTFYPGHISMYLGQDLMVHAPNSGNRVQVRTRSQRSNQFGDAFAEHLVVDSSATRDVAAPALGSPPPTDW